MAIPSIIPINLNLLERAAALPVKSAGLTENMTRTFGEVLNALNQSQSASDAQVSALASGDNVDLHNLMITAEENDVNFKVTMAIRDRLVDAYREVMRMSI
jgi:flagellar hook-basal body complex protein FliE